MVFAYYGKVERLAREVEQTRDAIDTKYLEIFGRERYEKLEKISKRVLVPECYFESLEYISQYTGHEIPKGTKPSPMHILEAIPTLSNFRKRLTSIVITSLFHISEDSIRNSPYYNPNNNYPYLPTYVHEFNHFIVDMLQCPPITIFRDHLLRGEEQIKDEKSFQCFIEKIEKEKLAAKEKRRKMQVTLADFLLDSFVEEGTRILDKLVLEGICNLSLPWRDKRMVFIEGRILRVPEAFYMPIFGDMFYGAKDLEVINQLINWQDHFQLPFDNSYLQSLFQKSKKILVKFIPLTEFIEQFGKYQ